MFFRGMAAIILGTNLFAANVNNVHQVLNEQHINVNYDQNNAYKNFLQYTKPLGPKSAVLKDTAKSGRILQTYVTDGFKNGTKISVKQWGDDYLLFSKDKQYLTSNDFYVIDFITIAPLKEKEFVGKAMVDNQTMLLQWKSAVDNYNEKNFEKAFVALSDKIIPHSFLYSSAVNYGKNPNQFYIMNISKFKKAGEQPMVSSNKKDVFYLKMPGLKNEEIKAKSKAQNAVAISDTRVVVSGEELSRIDAYIKKHKSMIKYPLVAKIDCMTKVKEAYRFDYVVNPQQDGTVTKKTKDQILKSVYSNSTL